MSLHEKLTVEMKNSTDMKNIHKGTGSQRLFVLNNTNLGRYLSRKKMRMNEGVVDVSPKPYV